MELQQNDYFCGPVVMVTLLNDLKRGTLSQGELAFMLETTRTEGTSCRAMEEFPQRFGLSTLAMAQADLVDLIRMLENHATPVVGLNIEGIGHYAIVRDVNGHVKLEDPLRGNVRLSRDAFCAEWYAGLNEGPRGWVLAVSSSPESLIVAPEHGGLPLRDPLGHAVSLYRGPRVYALPRES